MRAIYNLRCLLCELFIKWSLAIAPKDYVPSSVQSTIDMLDEQKRSFQQLARKE